jgi:hypothetical protein
MKIIITERQYSLYLRRRYPCVGEYIDQLKSGDENLLIPPSSFKWDTYKYILTATIRKHCGEVNGGFFDEDIHNDIMEMFGDDLFEIYEKNK